MRIDQVALQLYTLREHLRTPAEIVAGIGKITAMGYRAVEAYELREVIAAGELRRVIADAGSMLCSAPWTRCRLLAELRAVATEIA